MRDGEWYRWLQLLRNEGREKLVDEILLRTEPVAKQSVALHILVKSRAKARRLSVQRAKKATEKRNGGYDE